MEIIDLVKRFAGHSGVAAVQKVWGDDSVRTMHFKGLSASAAPMLFASLAAAEKSWQVPVALFVLNDLEEAGYFYHDLTQMLGDSQVLFLPSSYKRAIKYGQKDSANEVLRTEVLTRLTASPQPSPKEREQLASRIKSHPSLGRRDVKASVATAETLVSQPLGRWPEGEKQRSPAEQGLEGRLYIVTYPDALAEMVVSRDTLNTRSVALAVGDTVEIPKIEATLTSEGFERVDYVYEPGQFAVRGSIIDVFSYASEYPFRIDLFGDEIDSIRTFEIETQLSRDKVEHISIVPNFDGAGEQGQVSFFDFLPDGSALAFQDYLWVHERLGALERELKIENSKLKIESAITPSDFYPDGDNSQFSIFNYWLLPTSSASHRRFVVLSSVPSPRCLQAPPRGKLRGLPVVLVLTPHPNLSFIRILNW